MQGRTVAILEARTGEHLAELLARRGALPLHAPALEEIPDVDSGALAALIDGWAVRPVDVAVFQTGVGAQALFQAAAALGLEETLARLLAGATVVVRGPKPVAALAAHRVRIDARAASPFTTDTVIAALEPLPLAGKRVLVQRYGSANARLCAALAARGASVEELATYRWALPTDTAPLARLLAALAEQRVDAVLFTSAVQIHHLAEFARARGAESAMLEGLARTLVGSIGPVCSRALREHGIEPAFEAAPPKLGALVANLDVALAGRPRR